MSAAVKNNFQEYDPRHRLTGAVVLILLAIILLPMLLSKNPDDLAPEADPVVMEVTKKGKKVFVSRITSVDPAKVSAAPETKKPADKTKSSEKVIIEKKDDNDLASSALFKPMSHTATAKQSATKPSTTKNTATKAKSETPGKSKSSVKKETSKPAASKSTVQKKPAVATVSQEWILQVGVFSQSANANKKVTELKKKGFNAKSGKVKTSKGVATKVWIGPFKDRSSAEKMQDRLQHKTRQRGMVVKK